MHTRPGINHVLHLILSIITLGFWLVVWLILAIAKGAERPRCVNCGTQLGAFTPPRAVAAPAGWYPSPEDEGQRYWDGAQWTDHTSA